MKAAAILKKKWERKKAEGNDNKKNEDAANRGRVQSKRKQHISE